MVVGHSISISNIRCSHCICSAGVARWCCTLKLVMGKQMYWFTWEYVL
ncbi:unnamed protein product [Rhodiola kirilowii]